MHYVRGLIMHYMAAVHHLLGNKEAQADCYHAQVSEGVSKGKGREEGAET